MAWIAELDAVSAKRPPVRVPLRGNVPATPRLLRLLDTAPIQRLRGVRQMGQADLVYPGAVHSRFEHSLGTYDLMRRMLAQLLEGASGRLLREDDLRCLLVAALCHDVGHYPFSHTLEGIAPLPRHEERTRRILLRDPQVVEVLRGDWRVDPERVAAVVDESVPLRAASDLRLRELLSGPLNPDRLDYLERDSHHAGVPYGRAIDSERLMGAIAFAPDGIRLGVSPKGVSAVETLIFASYLMYRELYWHHTVRAAQAMVRRAVTEALRLGELDLDELAAQDDGGALARLRACPNAATTDLVGRVTGSGRRLYRRVWTGSLQAAADTGNAFLQAIAGADYWEQVAVCTQACRGLAAGVPDHALLVDVAGQGKELFFEVPVIDGGSRTTADPEVSLLAPSLARNFDRQAKRVQVLALPEHVADFRRHLGLAALGPEPGTGPGPGIEPRPGVAPRTGMRPTRTRGGGGATKADGTEGARREAAQRRAPHAEPNQAEMAQGEAAGAAQADTAPIDVARTEAAAAEHAPVRRRSRTRPSRGGG